MDLRCVAYVACTCAAARNDGGASRMFTKKQRACACACAFDRGTAQIQYCSSHGPRPTLLHNVREWIFMTAVVNWKPYCSWRCSIDTDGEGKPKEVFGCVQSSQDVNGRVNSTTSYKKCDSPIPSLTSVTYECLKKDSISFCQRYTRLDIAKHNYTCTHPKFN